MSLLDELPSTEQFNNILKPVLGNSGDGSGVAGVLKLLETLNSQQLAGSVSGRLKGNVSAKISIDTTTLNGGVIAQLKGVVTGLPSNPAELVGPLADRLKGLAGSVAGDLPGSLSQAILGLQNAQIEGSGDPNNLLSDALAALNDLKSELNIGAFDDLRQWGTQVSALVAEIEPILSGPNPGDALLVFVAGKLGELVAGLLPDKKSLADLLGSELDAALTPDRIAKIASLKAELLGHMAQAQTVFAGSDFANTAELDAARVSFTALTTELSDILGKLQKALQGETATPDGLSGALGRQIANLATAEVIDLTSVQKKFQELIDRIKAAVDKLNLSKVKDTVQGVFDKINSAIDEVNLRQFEPKLDELQAKVQSAIDALDGELLTVVAAIRNIFTQIKQTLESAANSLGTFDAGGHFNFKLKTELEDFLNGVKTSLHDTIQPILDDFKNTIGGTLQQVKTGLDAVKNQIETVKDQLKAALEEVTGKLQTLDVPGKLQEIAGKLDEMLDQLGTLNFDVVVDPVVAQIEKMRDQLKKIDISSLSEITVGALKVSVEVVVEIDFSSQITGVVMNELDKVLQVPKDALADLETGLKKIIDRFGELGPDIILQPLDKLFAPVKEKLDALELDQLLKPINDWYESALAELDKISPVALLKPVIEVYDQLQKAFASVTPGQLLQPLQGILDELKSNLQKLNLGSIAGQLATAVQSVRNLLDRYAPGTLLQPLSAPFDLIATTLDGFDPAALLTPVTTFFNKLADPLDNLTSVQVAALGAAFAPLAQLPSALDPQVNFSTVGQKFAGTQSLVTQINLPGLMADLKAAYDKLHLSVAAGPAELNASVDQLNPLSDGTLGTVAVGLPSISTKLQTSFIVAPKPELIAQFKAVQPKLQGLVPSWVKADMTVDSVKEAIKKANPLNIGPQLNQLWDIVKQQYKNVDPRLIINDLQVTYDHVKEVITVLDPADLVNRVQTLLDSLTGKLNVLNLSIITDELNGLAAEIQNFIAGLDPRPVVAALDGLAGEVKNDLLALKPSELLAGLQAPLDEAKAIVAEFDPESFHPILEEAFGAIKDVLDQIDLGVILQPLLDKLQELRDALADALGRAEGAFNEMLQAIPV